MNSLMSTLIRASSVPNICSASCLASRVLPTPVGPRKRNEPIGLLGFFKPHRLLLIALARVSIALSCAITFDFRAGDRFFSFSPSSLASFCTGIPVIIDTTEAIFSSSTISRRLLSDTSQSRFITSSSPSSDFSRSRKRAANSKS
ncbi:MAG: hypothetical protein BWY95_02714 [Bacteroidetes bacterium ADurb.BinA104]|nr:MAG: hypothetical protein BWY95_02714 [Bacteroidetes bacterium ADurb.BinA104]